MNLKDLVIREESLSLENNILLTFSLLISILMSKTTILKNPTKMDGGGEIQRFPQFLKFQRWKTKVEELPNPAKNELEGWWVV